MRDLRDVFEDIDESAFVIRCHYEDMKKANSLHRVMLNSRVKQELRVVSKLYDELKEIMLEG